MFKQGVLAPKILFIFGCFFLICWSGLTLTQGRVLGLTIKINKTPEAEGSAQIIETDDGSSTLATFPDVTPGTFLAATSDGQAVIAGNLEATETTSVLDYVRLTLTAAYLALGLTAVLAFLAALSQICLASISPKKRQQYLRLLRLALTCLVIWLGLGLGAVFIVFGQF
jgi:hypothetical protein